VNRSGHPLPDYSTPFSAGMDIRANLSESITLRPLENRLVPTGLLIELPEGFEAQIRPRSGLALKKGISVVNDGERICQMVINKVEKIAWTQVDSLEESERGAGGFGHTGRQ